METKRCKKCQADKSTEDFYKNGKTLQSSCKLCQNQYTSEYHAKTNYYQRNIERIKENRIKWFVANPDYHFKYNENNSEKSMQASRKCRQDNQEAYNVLFDEVYERLQKRRLISNG